MESLKKKLLSEFSTKVQVIENLKYKLNMIIAVGDRVNSKKATQSRIWQQKF